MNRDLAPPNLADAALGISVSRCDAYARDVAGTRAETITCVG